MKSWFGNQLLSRGQGQWEKGKIVMEVPVTILNLLPDIGTLLLAKGFPAFLQQKLGWMYFFLKEQKHLLYVYSEIHMLEYQKKIYIRTKVEK